MFCSIKLVALSKENEQQSNETKYIYMWCKLPSVLEEIEVESRTMHPMQVHFVGLFLVIRYAWYEVH